MTCPICGAYAPPCTETGYDGGDEPCSDRCDEIYRLYRVVDTRGVIHWEGPAECEPDIPMQQLEKEPIL